MALLLSLDAGICDTVMYLVTIRVWSDYVRPVLFGQYPQPTQALLPTMKQSLCSSCVEPDWVNTSLPLSHCSRVQPHYAVRNSASAEWHSFLSPQAKSSCKLAEKRSLLVTPVQGDVALKSF